MSFNTKTYDSTNNNYNANFDTYIIGSNNVPVDGVKYYNNKFGQVMTSFIVDNGDSILGGNLIVTNDTTIHGICDFKNDVFIGGNVFIPGNLITSSTNLITGQQGERGWQGETGETGSKGETGETGLKGETGEIGETGLTGSTGSQGIQGSTGLNGSQGIQGLTGLTGPQGIQGLTGPSTTTTTYNTLPTFTSRQIGYSTSVFGQNVAFLNFTFKKIAATITLLPGVHIVEYSALITNMQSDTGYIHHGMTTSSSSFQNFSTDKIISENLHLSVNRLQKTTVINVQNEMPFYLMMSTDNYVDLRNNDIVITNCKITATRLA